MVFAGFSTLILMLTVIIPACTQADPLTANPPEKSPAKSKSEPERRPESENRPESNEPKSTDKNSQEQRPELPTETPPPSTSATADPARPTVDSSQDQAPGTVQSDPNQAPPEPTEEPQRTYTDQQLNKNGTILVLAFQPDIRADFLVMLVRSLLDEEQAKQAKEIALSYDWRYVDIRKKRADLLETVTDENKAEVDAKLRDLRIEIFELNQEIRARINREILTPEQRKQLQKRYQKD